MNVLSCFDGIAAGRVALERSEIKVYNYFASEIDKWAIKIAKKNHPDIIELGDINNWQSWNLPKIDLLIGGSPCQGFSNAGRGLNFEDPRSKLFFTFVDILKNIKPKYFFLENVRMKKEWQDIISEYMGVQPIKINSALVSAQNRERLYWTNIPFFEQPEDKKIYLKDIIESGSVDRDKSYCIDANYFKGGSLKMYKEKARRQIVNLPSEPSIAFHQSEKRLMVKECLQVGEADIKGHDIIKRVYSVDGKSPSLTTMQGGHREPKIANSESTWRKLTPLECERLQTFDDNYTEGISNTQRYKCLGNSWTVDVIVHFFKNLKTGEN